MVAAVTRAVAGAGAGLADVSDTLSLLLQLHELVGGNRRHGGRRAAGGQAIGQAVLDASEAVYACVEGP